MSGRPFWYYFWSCHTGLWELLHRSPHAVALGDWELTLLPCKYYIGRPPLKLPKAVRYSLEFFSLGVWSDLHTVIAAGSKVYKNWGNYDRKVNS